MFKKICFLLIPALALSISCGKGGKYADVKAYMQDMIKINESFITSMEKASSSKDMVSAIDTFGDQFVKANEKGNELMKKYPELKDQEKTPEELKPEYDKIHELSGKLTKVMQAKMAIYMRDPAVLGALQRFGQKMQKLDIPGMKTN